MTQQERHKQQQLGLSWDESGDAVHPAENASTAPETTPEEGEEETGNATAPSEIPETAAAEGADKTAETPLGETSGDTDSQAASSAAAPTRGVGPPRTRKRAGEAATLPAVGAEPEHRATIPPDRIEAASLGEILREAREQLDLDVAQVAKRTRVPPSFLYSVEADQFDRMPAPIYSKSHVRTLCLELGLDSAPLIEKLLQGLGASEETRRPQGVRIRSEESDAGSLVTYHLPAEENAEHSSRVLNPMMLLFGAILAGIALLVIVAIAVQNLRNRGETPPPPHSTEERQGSEDDPAAKTTEPPVDFEACVVPQVLPVKELPLPEK